MSDLKINPALCFEPTEIIRYLNTQIKDDTLHSELVASMVMRLVIEKVYEWSDYLIYFYPKDNRQKELLAEIGNLKKIELLPEFLGEYVDQNSPYDFLYVNPNHPSEAEVRPVQFKRFGIGLEPELITNKFVDYLKELNHKYSPIKASLLVYLQNKGTIDFEPIVRQIKVEGFPFQELQMFSYKPNGDAHICQIYPSNVNVNCLIFSNAEIKGINV